MSYNLISDLIVNILRVALIKKTMELFLPAEQAGKRKAQAGFVFYYLLTAAMYHIFHISLPYELGSCLGILGLTLLYRAEWRKRIWISLVIFGLDMACSLAVYFVLARTDILYPQQPFQTLLLLICVTIVSALARPADSGELPFAGKQTGILIVIPSVSIFILCVLLYGRYESVSALLICVSTLAINLSVFYLYHTMAESYQNLRENEIYRQQTYAYRNQLDVILESQSRIRALRHDMKNHMLALQLLLRKKDWEEADRYLSSMQDFMTNPTEYVATGNEAVDSLLNYKLQRADGILNTVEARVSIPEKPALHPFDLNVVLGNLLDNAIEAAERTEEKRLKIAVKLDRGILFINLRNSCRDLPDGRIRRLETTKEDAPNHGIGLGNVRKIVEKYHGEMDLACENGTMETDIIMYLKDTV